MITFITGTPGAGKTLYALHLMREEFVANKRKSELSEGDKGYEPKRNFYCNVDGCTFDWLSPWPEDHDWRNLPDGSYVLYDEAHQDHLFPQKGAAGSRAADKRIRDMDEHRHRGFDMTMVTQWPNKVHHEVRTLANKHVHLSRGTGAQIANVTEWTTVKTTPTSKSVQADGTSSIWSYPKDLFDFYRSATVHTSSYKFKMPMKLVGYLFSLAMIPVILWVLWSTVFSPEKQREKAKAAVAASATQGARASDGASLLPPGYEAVNSDGTPIDQLATQAGVVADEQANGNPQRKFYPGEARACVIGVSSCRCWDSEGLRITVEPARCRSYVVNGFPRLDMQGPANAAQSVPVVAAASVTSVPVAVSAAEGVGNGRVVKSALTPIGGI